MTAETRIDAGLVRVVIGVIVFFEVKEYRTPLWVGATPLSRRRCAVAICAELP